MKKSAISTVVFMLFAVFSLTRDVFAIDKLKGFSLILENHVYNPDILYVPYNKKVKLVIYKNDDTAEMFFSLSLKRKKLVPGHSQAVFYIGPLKVETTHFMDIPPEQQRE
jgi:hypothetical protein